MLECFSINLAALNFQGCSDHSFNLGYHFLMGRICIERISKITKVPAQNRKYLKKTLHIPVKKMPHSVGQNS
jgi:hypothetical protein